MKLTIDRNCNIRINDQHTGYVAQGAHSISGQTSVSYGVGYQKTEKQRTVHVSEVYLKPLWVGHISELTLEVFLEATGYEQDDTIVITAPAGTKARWVRQSQAEGAKLSDWVIHKVEQA